MNTSVSKFSEVMDLHMIFFVLTCFFVLSLSWLSNLCISTRKKFQHLIIRVITWHYEESYYCCEMGPPEPCNHNLIPSLMCLNHLNLVYFNNSWKHSVPLAFSLVRLLSSQFIVNSYLPLWTAFLFFLIVQPNMAITSHISKLLELVCMGTLCNGQGLESNHNLYGT